ncbi:MAG: hypothetical protein AAFY88_20045, partial [Acidobacteriota bacterium]
MRSSLPLLRPVLSTWVTVLLLAAAATAATPIAVDDIAPGNPGTVISGNVLGNDTLTPLATA